jgi:predicted metal-dependent hydrolase
MHTTRFNLANDKPRAALWEAVKRLRFLAAPSDGRAVRVRVIRKMPVDRLGDCSKCNNHYLIRLSAELVDNYPDALSLLLAHEWAHALVWEHCTHDHGDAWGIAVAKAWRIITGEIAVGDINAMD